ncbi:MAG TPA: alpha/beta hydrolase [Gammaproteobacteria bacterium]
MHSVLLIDLPAHGESEGDRITFGFREAKGVSAALAFLRGRLPSERIGVIAVSLGAASLIYSNPSRAPDAVVLESVYPTIKEAVEARLALRLGDIGKSMAPLLLGQLPLRLGISRNDLQPIVRLPKLGAPVLIVAGAEDLHTTLPETQRLFAAAQSPKELWIMDGAAHVNLYDYGPAAYEAKVVTFLARHLRNGT